MQNIQHDNSSNDEIGLFARFLVAWVVISLLFVPTLMWPYFLLAKLPSDVRIAIPFLAIFFLLSFLFAIVIWARLRFSQEKITRFQIRFFATHFWRQTIKLILLFLMQITAGCVAGVIWLNLRLLSSDSLSLLPLWIWCFLPAVWTLVLLFIVNAKGSPTHAFTILMQSSSRKTLLLTLSFLSAIMIALGVVKAFMFYFRTQANSFSNINLSIAMSVVLPLFIFDLNLLFSFFQTYRGENVLSIFGLSTYLERKFGKDSNVAVGIRSAMSDHPVIISLLLTSFYFLLNFTVLRTGYGVNDDIQMIAMASGYWGGKPVPFLVFSNVILGFFLNFLYSLNTSANWEIWLFFTVHFFSILALVFIVLSNKAVQTIVKMFGVLIIMLIEMYFLLNITFTTAAVASSIAGACLLLTEIQARSLSRKFLVVWGYALILIAGLIRIESVALVFLSLIPFLINRQCLLNVKIIIPIFGIIGCLLLGLYMFDNLYVGSFPAWTSYKAYTQTRSMIHDTPRLTNVDGTIKEIGWSANDFDMFERWFFTDPHVYSIEKLQYLVQHVSDKQKTIFNLILSLPDRLSGFAALPYILDVWRNN